MGPLSLINYNTIDCKVVFSLGVKFRNERMTRIVKHPSVFQKRSSRLTMSQELLIKLTRKAQKFPGGKEIPAALFVQIT
jgi:hypothetical protein